LPESIERPKKTRKRRYVERKTRRKQQRRLQQQTEAAIRELVGEGFERALRDEVTLLLGRARSVRRDVLDQSEVAACCNKCQTHLRARFYRAGYYRRSLLTFEVFVEIRMPRLSCVCGGMVDFESLHLEPYGRVWFDLEERARELAGLCVSLRDSVRVLARQNAQPLSIATLNARVNQTAELAESFHRGPFERVPQVVMLDGIWLSVLLPTDERYVDKKGRSRRRSKLKRFPLLVAYGVDPVSGERWVLDWERGEEEYQTSWQRLLERLLERGLHADRGLRLFVHDGSKGLEKAFEMVWFGKGVERQRCVFHKLLNVSRDVQGDETMSRKDRQARRREVLKDAAEVYRGRDAPEIKGRLDAFSAKWRDKEPKAVATLERDFDQTLVYLRVLERARAGGQEWRVEALRTTSPLERVQRHFRQKARQVVIAHSERGVEADIELVIIHRGLASPDKPTLPWTRQLEEALLAA
jgi:transposase-like protein